VNNTRGPPKLREDRAYEVASDEEGIDAAGVRLAMLNFSTAIVTARLTRAIVAMGLDPCFGFLHDGRKPGRLSLVWDCVAKGRRGGHGAGAPNRPRLR
jgi:CRISPR associated protein Cas1